MSEKPIDDRYMTAIERPIIGLLLLLVSSSSCWLIYLAASGSRREIAALKTEIAALRAQTQPAEQSR